MEKRLVCLCVVHIRQVWCTVETSQDEEIEAKFNVSFEFHFDASFEDDETRVGLDSSFKFPFDVSFEFH